jgi:hypothetical protein
MSPEHDLDDTQKLRLPQELVSALNNRKEKPQADYHIESLRPSFLGRLVEKLLGSR